MALDRRYNHFDTSVHPSDVCKQDYDIIYGPTFTKFRTQLSHTMQKEDIWNMHDH